MTDLKVICKIQNGRTFKIQVRSDWAPLGAERFIDLVKDHYYDGTALFRAQKDITIQFGIPHDKSLQKKWLSDIGSIQDDPKLGHLFKQSHWKRGLISYAGGGANSRSAQIFITLNDDIPHLGGELWETPFAEIIDLDSGIDVLKNDIYYEYGDRNGPDQGRIFSETGYQYLKDKFPKLSYMEYCRIDNNNNNNNINNVMDTEINSEYNQLNGGLNDDLDLHWTSNNAVFLGSIFVIMIFFTLLCSSFCQRVPIQTCRKFIMSIVTSKEDHAV